MASPLQPRVTPHGSRRRAADLPAAAGAAQHGQHEGRLRARVRRPRIRRLQVAQEVQVPAVLHQVRLRRRHGLPVVSPADEGHSMPVVSPADEGHSMPVVSPADEGHSSAAAALRRWPSSSLETQQSMHRTDIHALPTSSSSKVLDIDRACGTGQSVPVRTPRTPRRRGEGQGGGGAAPGTTRPAPGSWPR